MARKRVKLASIVNETSRAKSLKKMRLRLLKKVRELTILCDLRACIIMFSPNEDAPMVWPSAETAHDLLDDFFSLPEIEKKKKETSLESYLKEKTRKVHEQLKKLQKKNLDSVIDQLMSQLQHGRGIADLQVNEVCTLLSFSREKIMLCRKRSCFTQHPSLRDPLRNTDEAAKTIRIGSSLLGNRGHYVMDQWVPFESPKPIIHQPIETEIIPYDQKPNPRISRTYHGSCSNGNPNLEMEPIVSQVMTIHGLAESVSQPLVHHNMNRNQLMATIQPRQHPFDFMSINTATTTNGFRQPPLNETNLKESVVDAMSFDINRMWPGNTNHHF